MTKDLLDKLQTHFETRQCDRCEEVMSDVHVEIVNETPDAVIVRIECRHPGCRFRGTAIVGVRKGK